MNVAPLNRIIDIASAHGLVGLRRCEARRRGLN
jgi:hypothetical protein